MSRINCDWRLWHSLDCSINFTAETLKLNNQLRITGLDLNALFIYFGWFGTELFCLLLGPPGFNCWFSFAPVFQWCCSTSQGSPGIGRNMFLSSPHLCFIIVFICDLFVSRDDPLMSYKTFTLTEQLYVLSHDRS